jgi:hypothetical protein
MQLEILKKCPHPSVPGKNLKKGDVLEVINDIGRDYCKKGFAKAIARTYEEVKVVNEANKQVVKRKEEKQGEE